MDFSFPTRSHVLRGSSHRFCWLYGLGRECEIRSFKLTPRDGQRPSFAPGQHVMVEVWIGGHWVRRPYTICSDPGSPYEIWVKREPRGILSTFLFDLGAGAQGVRVSEPRGPDLSAGAGLLVCLVAGIGVTPALALLRAQARGAAGPQLRVHWSVRRAAEAPGLTEIRELVERIGTAELVMWESAEGRRLSAGEARALAERSPGAHFLLCGPEGYMAMVDGALGAAGVGPERVRREEFRAVGRAVDQRHAGLWLGLVLVLAALLAWLLR